ncbi:BT2A2 protein, partial [Neodrepanis coruscans]|nr:BT2A2 protein [Neodrepanis coruscans]
AEVTLDPLTSHPLLQLSGDSLSVRWCFGGPSPPPGPERFQHLPCVLGRPSFGRGRHSWRVAVAGGHFCAVGVSRGSLGRSGTPGLCPAQGIWALQRWGGGGRALTDPPT